MAEQTTNKAEKGKKGLKRLHSKPFTSLEEAQAANPQDKRLALFTVAWVDGKPRYIWTDEAFAAIGRVALAEGATAAATSRVATPEKVEEQFLSLSDEQKTALLAKLGGVPSPAKGKKGKGRGKDASAEEPKPGDMTDQEATDPSIAPTAEG